MDQHDVERITRSTLRELGAGDAPLTVTPEGHGDRWKVVVGGSDPATLTIRAGAGTSPQFVREQIFTQFAGR